MKYITKKVLTIDSDTGSDEVKENIIANTGDQSLNDLVLAFDTESEIVFYSENELKETFLKLPKEVIEKCFSFDEWADFADEFGNEISAILMTKLDPNAKAYFASLTDFIWELVEQSESLFITEWYRGLRISAYPVFGEEDSDGNIWEAVIQTKDGKDL